MPPLGLPSRASWLALSLLLAGMVAPARAQSPSGPGPATAPAALPAPAPTLPARAPVSSPSGAPSGAALLQGDGPLVIGPGLVPASPAALAVPSTPAAFGAPSTPAALGSPAIPAAPGSSVSAPSTPAVPPAAQAAASPPPTALAASRELVLERGRRQLRVLENGRELYRFPVAVGMPGWETPLGRFSVLEKLSYPVWEHPQSGQKVPGGYANPLGSRWIGFHRDCKGRRGWDGDQMLDFSGCVVAGFHGTPHRWTVGRAVSHGCVRLYDEDVKRLYDLVSVGTPVTVVP